MTRTSIQLSQIFLRWSISHFHNHAQLQKVKNSCRPLDNQAWQTEWKTAPLARVQLCEYENQTLEAFVAASRLYAKYACPVACQNFSLLATVHDCETGLLVVCQPHINAIQC